MSYKSIRLAAIAREAQELQRRMYEYVLSHEFQVGFQFNERTVEVGRKLN